MNEPARYIMIGGFLGAGKTTAVARLARYLTDQGRRVGLICNDQSTGLVDTTLLRSQATLLRSQATLLIAYLLCHSPPLCASTPKIPL